MYFEREFIPFEKKMNSIYANNEVMHIKADCRSRIKEKQRVLG